MEDQIAIEEIVNKLFSTAPELITRKKLSEITGDVLSVKSLANLDSEGKGIQHRMRVGGKVAYPKAAAIEFYVSRCELY